MRRRRPVGRWSSREKRKINVAFYCRCRYDDRGRIPLLFSLLSYFLFPAPPRGKRETIRGGVLHFAAEKERGEVFASRLPYHFSFLLYVA